LEKNPRHSPKFYLAKAYTNIILDDIICIANFNVPSQVAFVIDLEKIEKT
jgi:hypothetical protein